jgi:hypothetical protein
MEQRAEDRRSRKQEADDRFWNAENKAWEIGT